MQFLNGEKVNEVLLYCMCTLLISFFLSKMDSSDLLVEPKNFLPGNSGRMICNLSLSTMAEIS